MSNLDEAANASIDEDFVKRALEVSKSMNTYAAVQKQKRADLWYTPTAGETTIKDGKLPATVRDVWVQEHVAEIDNTDSSSPKE